MSNGVGLQNFSSDAKYFKASGSMTKANESLKYTVRSGDTIDGDIATIIDKYGSDGMKKAIGDTYAKNQGIEGKLSDCQKDESLLWYAHLKSDNVARDSGIKNRNEINPGDVLNLKSLLRVSEEGGINTVRDGGLDLGKLGIDA